MAYFADAKAALTGTDDATRRSIAQGLVSPTFTDFSGNQVLRGVIQADVVTGRDTGYATHQTIAERLASAGRKLVSDTGGTFVYADRARESVGATTPPATTPEQLYGSPAGTIKTSTTLGLSKIQIAGVIGAVIIIGVLVSR